MQEKIIGVLRDKVRDDPRLASQQQNLISILKGALQRCAYYIPKLARYGAIPMKGS